MLSIAIISASSITVISNNNNNNNLLDLSLMRRQNWLQNLIYRSPTYPDFRARLRPSRRYVACVRDDMGDQRCRRLITRLWLDLSAVHGVAFKHDLRLIREPMCGHRYNEERALRYVLPPHTSLRPVLANFLHRFVQVHWCVDNSGHILHTRYSHRISWRSPNRVFCSLP